MKTYYFESNQQNWFQQENEEKQIISEKNDRWKKWVKMTFVGIC